MVFLVLVLFAVVVLAVLVGSVVAVVLGFGHIYAEGTPEERAARQSKGIAMIAGALAVLAAIGLAAGFGYFWLGG